MGDSERVGGAPGPQERLEKLSADRWWESTFRGFVPTDAPKPSWSLAKPPWGGSSQDTGALAVDALQWIQRVVIDSETELDASWSERIVKELRAARYPDSVIAAALSMARTLGYRLPASMMELQLSTPKVGVGNDDNNAPSVGEPEPMTEYGAKQLARELNARFVEYEIAGNVAGMEQMIAAILVLLWEWTRGKGKARQEQRRLAQVHQEILDNAPALSAYVRHVTPRELREMREAPTPDRAPRPIPRPARRARPPARGK